jgi:hypothetical protein
LFVSSMLPFREKVGGASTAGRGSRARRRAASLGARSPSSRR